jgi:hypothetical protein
MNINGVNINGVAIGDTIVSSLYAFTTFTFTPAGMIGATGPTLGNCYATYSNVGNTWLQNTAYFSVPIQGYQKWTVPADGVYEIEAAGSRAGYNDYAVSYGGQGAKIRGRFNLLRGQTLNIVVGQFAANTTTNSSYDGAGGGGGSFVVLGNVLTGGNTITMANATPLIVAGGGGGTGRWASWNAGVSMLGVNAVSTTSGTASRQANIAGAAGGTNGWGGNSHVAANGAPSSNSYDSGGGGGFFNGGVNGTGGNVRTNTATANAGGGGQAFANLAIGGKVATQYGPPTAFQASHGGFGGGGGGTPIAGGGGGGYSGGGGAWSGSVATASDGGGGGGSYIDANVISVVATVDGLYNGNATFNGITITNIGQNANIGYVRITRV